jgi:hypothetical protein
MYVDLHPNRREKNLAFIGNATPNVGIALEEDLKRTTEETIAVLLDILLSQRMCCQNNNIPRNLR